MKKVFIVGGLLLLMVSCKTSKHKCDAYGDTNIEYDIHQIDIESQKKYNSVTSLK